MKDIILKFFNNQASEQEVDQIMEWVNKSVQNREYFASLKAMHTISSQGVPAQSYEKTANAIRQSINNEQMSKSNRRYRLFAYFSSAAAVIAICFSIWMLLGNQSQNIQPIRLASSTPAQEIMNTLFTEKGVKGFTTLPDGSKVWLNSNTRISYPNSFSGKTRDVSLSGEAYFEVAKDSLMPMVITTNKNFKVEVLGTSFNIKSYDNDHKAETTLYNGSIRMHYKNNKSQRVENHTMKPNESFVYYDNKYEAKPTQPKNPQVQKAWKEGQLIFENTPMIEVIKMLERWHGTTFVINNKTIYKYSLTATFTTESIVQILDMMQYAMPIKYTYKDQTVTFI